MNIFRSMLDKAESLSEKSLFLFFFITAFIFRLPTLFNDFYDVDELAAIVQVREFLAGYTPGVDFKESKLPLYHLIFKGSYLASSEYGWVIVHVVTIAIVFLTALAVYKIGSIIKGRRAGIIAALLYAVLISSFNRHFMATNGEVIYNLPVTLGLLLFILVTRHCTMGKRIIYIALMAVSVFAAMMVKLHGAVLLLFILFFVFIYVPYYQRRVKSIIPYYLAAVVIASAVFAFDYFLTKKIAPGLASELYGLFFYASAGRSSSPFYFAAIYTYRQLTIGLWHFVLWIPAAVYMFRFAKNWFRRDTIEESAVAVFALVTFLMVFAGGARMYYHYFMTSYPSLCVIAAISLVSVELPVVKKLHTRFAAALMIPGVFFFAWNVKDIYIKYFNKELFYNEPAPLFWFRAVVVSSVDDYLLPNKIYRDTVEYIKTNTKPDDTIFVWGSGPHLYYFSNRRIAIYHVWPQGSAESIERLYRVNTKQSIAEAEQNQFGFINYMEKRKPALFIDTSPKGLHRGVTRLGSFAMYPYNVPPLMKRYLDRNYKFEKSVDSYKIYRRIK